MERDGDTERDVEMERDRQVGRQRDGERQIVQETERWRRDIIEDRDWETMNSC